jgi:hypothetical protein
MKHHRDHPPADAPAAVGYSAEDQRLEVSHAEMNAAHDSGEAIPFTETIPWLVRYDNSWWVVYDHGWLRITDDLTAADLDNSEFASSQMARSTLKRVNQPGDGCGVETEI